MSTRLFNDGAKFMFAENAADYIGNGAIHVPIFEKQILDRTKKRGTLLQRVQTKVATGHPTRYFEKAPVTNMAKFVDPRAIDHNLDTSVKRVEHSANIKALVDGITFTRFDVEVTQSQGLFNDLQGQDLNEMVTDVLAKQDQAVWDGAATSLLDATSTEYCNIFTQITKTGTIAATARITSKIRSAVAELMANKQYTPRPSAIYINPLDLATLEEQEEEASDKIKVYDVEVLPGIVIKGIMTAAGVLPLITDVFCTKGKVVITDESLLERQYITSSAPRVFQMGTQKDLANRFIAILFDTFIVKGGSYGHMVLTIDGATTTP